VIGVNDDELRPEHQGSSIASCQEERVAPVARCSRSVGRIAAGS